jgi:plasmid stabilization system protein ParE
VRRIVFDPAVKSDLRTTKRFCEDETPGLGDDFIAIVRSQFERIARFPLAAPIVEKGVRKAGIEVFPFEIYYCVDDREIFVFAVVHKRRHQDTWKKRLRKTARLV